MSFRFKSFTIEQDCTAMKVGTDGVLLGAWAAMHRDVRRVLDIGTGTGLIAIMAAQRTSDATIVGVEIEPSSAEQARCNAAHSPWCQRIEIVESSIQRYISELPFDVILSNPPYFVDSLHAKSESRTTARHTVALSFEELISAVERLLSPHGHFSLVLPPHETELFDELSRGRLHLWRRCCVAGKVGGVVRRVMSEYSLSPTSSVEHDNLAIRATPPEEYTEEYRCLTADFYLKF